MRSPLPAWAKAAMVAGLAPGLFLFFVMWLAPLHGVPEAERIARATRGFANMWAAGRAAAGGRLALLADQPAYAAWVRSLFGRGMPEQVWGYPPTMLLLAVPFSAIPLAAGFAAWTAGTAAAFWASARRAGLPSGAAAAAVLSPAALNGALAGQNGALTAALLIGALCAAGRRPALCGALLGILTLKPQIGLLAPVCLIALGDWRAFIWALAAAALGVWSSAVLFGFAAWHGFLAHTAPGMGALLTAPWTGAPAQADFASPFMAARALGAPAAAAWLLQAVISSACAAVCWRAWRRRRSPDGRTRMLLIAATVPLSLLATPYAHDYDLVGTSFTAAAAALSGLPGPGLAAALVFGWVWPGLSQLAAAAGLPAAAPPLSCATLAALAWAALETLRRPAGGGAPSAAER